MSIFILRDQERELLRRLRPHAEANPFSIDDMLDRQKGDLPLPGQQEEFRCLIPENYTVIFTLEPNLKGGLIRRLSVATVPGRMPRPETCMIIMEELGFKHALGSADCVVNVENRGDLKAINIMERFE
jgi:hypothetical protein